jgi:hypothetical protein
VFKQNVKALSADGLLQRFIPAILRGRQTRLGHPVPEYMTSAAAWENTLRMVFALPVQTYRLSPEAYEHFRTFQRWYEDAKQDERLLDSGPEYMTAFGKLEGTAGRLILLFHVIESPFSPYVSAEIVDRVVNLVRGYVIPAYRYALGEVAGVIEDSFDQWVIDHIIQNSADTTMVDLRTLKRSARRKLDGLTEWQKDQKVLDAMLVLEQAGWAIQVESEYNKRRVTWAINPGLATMFKDHRVAVIKAKQRHADYIYRHALDKGKERKLVKGYDPSTMD